MNPRCSYVINVDAKKKKKGHSNWYGPKFGPNNHKKKNLQPS